MKNWSLNTILVPLGGTENVETVLDAAIAVARRFNAHVRVWHVSPDPADALHAAGMALPGRIRKSVIEAGELHSHQIAETVHSLFRDYCENRQIPILQSPPAPEDVSASWHEQTGKESRVVMQRGRLADLIVLPSPRGTWPHHTLEAALFESGKPVLVVPPNAPQMIGDRIVVGWNGSLAAARAVAAARPFLVQAEDVRVLCPTDGATQSLPGEELIEELAWIGVHAEIQLFDAIPGSMGKGIMAEVHKLKADLLVMGGIGRTRMRELIMGRSTRYVLAESDVAAFMAG